MKRLTIHANNQVIELPKLVQRDDWEQIQDSIPSGPSRRNVAIVVYEIRKALGLQADHALDIYPGYRNFDGGESPGAALCR